MEVKKTRKADLERKKTLFVQIGLVITLSMMLIAFGWKTNDTGVLVIEDKPVIDGIIDLVPITEQRKLPIPAPPIAQITLLNEVDNNLEVEDFTVNVEVTQSDKMEPYILLQKDDEVKVVEEELWEVVEQSPQFPGGEIERVRFLSSNLHYPKMASEIGVEGIVYVSFVVEKNGDVTDVRVLRGIGGGCDEEAIRVIQAMPRWSPGKQWGKPVRVKFSLQVKFALSK